MQRHRPLLVCALASITLGLGCADLDDPDPVAAEASQALATPWWKATFVGGKSQHMRQPWNVGYTFFSSENGEQDWVNNMGGKPDVIAGSSLNVSDGASRADTWEELAGGPATCGDAPAVSAGSQLLLASSAHLHEWFEPGHDQTWAVFALPTVPRRAVLDSGRPASELWQRVADGAFDGYYRCMGARLRRYLVDHGKDPSKLILRPNWELNHNTALLPSFFDPACASCTVSLYNRMLQRFATSFRAGYGSRIRIILSVMWENSRVPCYRLDGSGRCAVLEDFVSGTARTLYDLVEVTYHPSAFSVGNGTDAEMQSRLSRMLTLGWPEANRFSLEDAFAIARKRPDLGVAITEWSPEDSAGKTTKFARESVDQLYDLLAQPSHAPYIAFTAGHNPCFIHETCGSVPAAFAAEWRAAVIAHKTKFGRR